MSCVPISVRFEIHTPDERRRITFDLNRSCGPNDAEHWTIHFSVFERKKAAAEFELAAATSVAVVAENHAAAGEVARNGLCEAQTAAAFVAADSLIAAERGDLPLEDAHDDIQAILTAG